MQLNGPVDPLARPAATRRNESTDQQVLGCPVPLDILQAQRSPGGKVCIVFQNEWYGEVRLVLRLLTRGDLITISSLLNGNAPRDEMQREEAVLRLCLVDPTYDSLVKRYHEIPAGVITRAVQKLLHLSLGGAEQMDTTMKFVEWWRSTEEGRAELMAVCFLHIPLSMIWSMPMLEWASTVDAALTIAALNGLDTKKWMESGEISPIMPPPEAQNTPPPNIPGLPSGSNVQQEWSFQWRKQR